MPRVEAQIDEASQKATFGKKANLSAPLPVPTKKKKTRLARNKQVSTRAGMRKTYRLLLFSATARALLSPKEPDLKE